MKPKVLDEHEAAAYIGVSVYTMQKWRSERRGPPFKKFERCVRYSPEELDRYLEEATVKPIS